MIIFEKIRWQNFLSTGNEFTEIDFTKHKTNLIIGKNGHGKSTLLCALTFVLFNKPFRDVNKPQLINTITKKNCLVEIDFSTKNNSYMIRRGMKPNIFEIYINGKLRNQDSSSDEYQKYLEETILKIDYGAFCQIVVFGSAAYEPFMQLTTPKRRELVEEFLSLKQFTTMNAILKTKVAQNTQKLSDVERDLKTNIEKQQLLKTFIEKQSSDISNQIQLIDSKIKINQNIINEHKGKIISLREQLLNKVNDVLDKSSINKKIEKINKVDAELKLNKNLLTKENNFLEHEKNCPTCKQPIDIQFKCDKIEQNSKKLEQINLGFDKLKMMVDEIKIQQQTLLKQEQEIQSLKADITKYEISISSLESVNKDLEKQKTTEIVDTSDSQDKLNVLLDEEVQLKIRKSEYAKLKTTYSHVQNLLKDTGIKASIIKQYIPLINKIFNSYLSNMNAFFNFEIDENFKETIKSRYRDTFSYNSFSEGEKFRIDLASILTWREIVKRRNAFDCNIMVMDEIMDSSLDLDGMEDFMKILLSLTKTVNVFLISHKTDVTADRFENVILFEKKKNFSRMRKL